MLVQERFDLSQTRDEVMRQVGQRNFAADDQQCNAVAYHGRQFVGRIANAQIVAEGDAPVFSAVFKPLLVGAIRRKEIVVPLDGEAGGREDIGKAFA